LQRIFQQKIAPKLLKIDQDNVNLRTKFSAQNVDFSCLLSFDFLSSRNPP